MSREFTSDPENTMKILVATDNHLGFMEKDPVRGDDSFRAFEEILRYAQKEQVDFILLGGDLFHDNKPSRNTLYKTMELFRKYCFGDKPCEIDIVSDQSHNFIGSFSIANYMSNHFNIAFPVFIIHGNHDDPSGGGNFSAIELLSVSGMLNYFGKVQDLSQEMQVHPILLTKGRTRLALYGLGNIRDERLYRMYEQNKVKMMEPAEEMESWFRLFVVHQNRVAHGPKNHLPEDFICDSVDLVVWGHEHECLIEPERNSNQQFWVSQPGSSVATSLIEGEAKPKHCALLYIKDKGFDMVKMRLKTVRPFVIEDVVLKDIPTLHPNDTKGVEKFIITRINQLITRAIEEWRDQNTEEENEELKVPLPLVRLRVEYSGDFTPFNPQRFGQKFVDKIANPLDVLYFYKKKQPGTSRGYNKDKNVKADEPDEDMLVQDFEQIKMDEVVNEYLKAQNLEVLPETELGEVITLFVQKDEKDLIDTYIDSSLTKTRKNLQEVPDIIDDKSIAEKAKEDKDKRNEAFSKSRALPIENKDSKSKKKKDFLDDAFDDGMELDLSESKAGPSTKKSASTRKAAPKKATTKTASKTSTRGRKSTKYVEESSEEEDDEAENEDEIVESQEEEDVIVIPDSGDEDENNPSSIIHSEEESVDEKPTTSRKRKAPAQKTKEPTKTLKSSTATKARTSTKKGTGGTSSQAFPSRRK